MPPCFFFLSRGEKGHVSGSPTCQNQFRLVSQAGRRRKTDRPHRRGPPLALLSLLLPSSRPAPPLSRLQCRKQSQPLTWGRRTMQRWKERSEGAWEQSEIPVELVVNRLGRGQKSVGLFLVLRSWWDNMSLTPWRPSCTENITTNTRVVKTGRKNLIWKMAHLQALVPRGQEIFY